MLGRAVMRAAPPAWQVTAVRHADLDITDAAALQSRMNTDAPDWVINCAAFTRVDAAESDSLAMQVNGDAPGLIGAVAAVSRARVLHISTDYLFDGTLGRPYREDDAPNPLSAYGRSKLAGERGLLASGADSLIVRTQWLYGEGGPSFVATMRSRALGALPVRVVRDQRGAPTNADDLAAMLWRLVQADARGIVHATAGGEASWYDVAREVYQLLGAAAALVTPCTTAEYAHGMRGERASAPRPLAPRPLAPRTLAPRPLDGRLDTARYVALTGHDPVPWAIGLRRFLAAG